MKKVMIAACSLLVLAFAASVWAADEDTRPARKRPQEQGAPIPPDELGPHQVRERGMPGMSRRDPNGMQQMMQDSLERKKQEHQSVVNELKNIKKIAESEKADKTATAIQKLIDEKEAAFKKQTEDIEKRRTEFKERMEQRRKEAGDNLAPGRKPIEQRKEKD